MLINYHAKNDKQGWQLVCSYPLDSDQWNDTDRSFINEMLKHGHRVITCGWNMWEIAPDFKPQPVIKTLRPINYGQRPLDLD